MWDTRTQRNTKKVEQVQRTAARFVHGDFSRTSSVTAMLNRLQWTPLQERRRQSRLVLLFKIRYGFVDVPWEQYLTHRTSSTRGHASRFINLQTRTDSYRQSFFPRTIRDWNCLSKDPAAFLNPDTFRASL